MEPMATVKEFVRWLTDQVDAWCNERGLPPGGGGEDLGDLYRHIEDTGALDESGVTVLDDPTEKVLYFVGPHASWIAVTPYELGIEQETIWFDPLTHLRTDVAADDLHRADWRLRDRADDFARAVGR